MAVLHFAYLFDPVAFGHQIHAGLTQGGTTALRHMAQAALATRHDTIKEVLQALRFDESWLGEDADECDRAEKWLLLTLAARLTKTTSLGRAGQTPHHLQLPTLLAEAKLPPAVVQRLLRGEPLHSLLHAQGLATLAMLLPALDDYGGWLSPAQARDLRQILINAAPNRTITVPPPYPLPSESDESFAAKAAYQAWATAIAMLDTAIHTQSALFLILD